MTNYNLKSVERYYQSKHISIQGDGKLNCLHIDGNSICYFDSKEEVDAFFEVLSDMFTAYEQINGFEIDKYSE